MGSPLGPSLVSPQLLVSSSSGSIGARICVWTVVFNQHRGGYFPQTHLVILFLMLLIALSSDLRGAV